MSIKVICGELFRRAIVFLLFLVGCVGAPSDQSWSVDGAEQVDGAVSPDLLNALDLLDTLDLPQCGANISFHGECVTPDGYSTYQGHPCMMCSTAVHCRAYFGLNTVVCVGSCLQCD
jgi:hypothetical protein